MIKNKLESLSNSKFKAFKSSAVSGTQNGGVSTEPKPLMHVNKGNAGSWSWTEGDFTWPPDTKDTIHIGYGNDFTGVLSFDGHTIDTSGKWNKHH